MPIRRWSAVQLFIPTPQYQPLSTCAYPRRPELRAELFCRRMEGTVSTAGTRTKYLVMQNQNPGSESEQVIQNMWCDGRVPTNPAASPVSGIVLQPPHHVETTCRDEVAQVCKKPLCPTIRVTPQPQQRQPTFKVLNSLQHPAANQYLSTINGCDKIEKDSKIYICRT